MADIVGGDTNHTLALEELTAAQKERLRAAMKILIEYLLAEGTLLQLRHTQLDKEKSKPVETKKRQTVAVDDSS